ncbi:MAG TPA: TraR/DksA family transcriptional regulator [Nannocystaceae bacterium]|nr:TraR/DksA family transcriptional regulator [Nannocystaceae bacterium]
MKADDLARFRRRLLDLRAQTLAAGDVAVEPVMRDAITKPDEDEAPLAEMSQVIASNRNRERGAALQAIDDALRRMADDPEGFGACESCDEPIPEARLLLLPHVRLCAECQADEEQTKTRTPGRRHLTDYR